ncbi:sodium:calcium antiporter [Candidatus Parcubacteria bacterium]|nr:MAG: sodium:calcium antiporter [Candidatus Parcubacteria bacterium]
MVIDLSFLANASIFIFWLIIGFTLLAKGADYMVDGAASIADRFGVSHLIIGLTIVAFGTSAPELAVNIFSAVQGSTAMALGNINGSNIANILLILGVASLITSIPIKSGTVAKEIPFMLLSGLVLLLLASDKYIEGSTHAILSRTDGFVLLTFFLVFLYYLFLSARNRKQMTETETFSLPVSFIMTLGGLIGLIIGAKIVVYGATGIAHIFHVSEGLIGLSLIAFGTSLPELASSVIAARKGKIDMAFGAIVGSNIFNILLVLGVTASITPIDIAISNVFDILIGLIAMLVLLVAVLMSKEVLNGRKYRTISRAEGVVFLLLYIAYIAYIFIRG